MGLNPKDIPKAHGTHTTSPEILVVGGGKGGVGKTCFSVNTAVEIARRGWRVILLDADLSCSNIETVLGFRSNKRLDDFF
ncbi:MAG: P-loop NTPase, partial [Candidatus Hydrogenedentes bacterium]|nr:P-loop NTPase [Candidatus Hydrogenedentota bacterium]